MESFPLGCLDNVENTIWQLHSILLAPPDDSGIPIHLKYSKPTG